MKSILLGGMYSVLWLAAFAICIRIIQVGWDEFHSHGMFVGGKAVGQTVCALWVVVGSLGLIVLIRLAWKALNH